jgi:hypothetical protein
MSKKQEFLQKEQSRDKHPERMMKGSAAEQTVAGQAQRGQAKGNPADHQVPGAGKVANDHNKQGEQAPTQKHEAQRTPESRHDRQNIGSGGHNEVAARKGGGGAGRAPRGAG